MHETLQPGQVHDLYHEAYMALLTFQIEDLTEKIGAITAAGVCPVLRCSTGSVQNAHVERTQRGFWMHSRQWSSIGINIAEAVILATFVHLWICASSSPMADLQTHLPFCGHHKC